MITEWVYMYIQLIIICSTQVNTKIAIIIN